jgi:hypothetical protein
MTTTDQTANNEKPADLTISDLQNLRTILDAACRRGAFGAAELSSVGAAYDKLNAFLNFIAKTQNPNENQQEPGA